jgi:hypothetical protein
MTDPGKLLQDRSNFDLLRAENAYPVDGADFDESVSAS